MEHRCDMDFIILAGGMGSRLKRVVCDVPKPMAKINGKPFLHYIVRYLKSFTPSSIIFSVGYKSQFIQDFFGDMYSGIRMVYSCEDTPLGTGGGLKKALALSPGPYVCILNGDSFFSVDFHKMEEEHRMSKADISIGLKPLVGFERYGRVKCGLNNRIVEFQEKTFCEEGYINAGVYIMSKSAENMFPDETLFPCFYFRWVFY